MALSSLGKPKRMYSADHLLHLVNSDGADALKLRVGAPPLIVIEGKNCVIEGPLLTAENIEELLHSLADTRQRRELRQEGMVQFIYRLRGCTDFVVCARMDGESIEIEAR